MSKEEESNPSISCKCNSSNNLKIESILTMDAKGQILLPKDVRERLQFAAGEKIALVVLENNGNPCCITLIKASLLSEGIKGFLEPLVK